MSARVFRKDGIIAAGVVCATCLMSPKVVADCNVNDTGWVGSGFWLCWGACMEFIGKKSPCPETACQYLSNNVNVNCCQDPLNWVCAEWDPNPTDLSNAMAKCGILNTKHINDVPDGAEMYDKLCVKAHQILALLGVGNVGHGIVIYAYPDDASEDNPLLVVMDPDEGDREVWYGELTHEFLWASYIEVTGFACKMGSWGELKSWYRGASVTAGSPQALCGQQTTLIWPDSPDSTATHLVFRGVSPDDDALYQVAETSAGDTMFVDSTATADSVRYFRVGTVTGDALTDVGIAEAGLQQVGELTWPDYDGQTGDLLIRGDYAYIAFDQEIMKIDISNPHAPVEVAHRSEDYSMLRELAINQAGDRLYVAQAGLEILDANSLGLICSRVEPEWSSDIAILDDIAYVARGNTGLAAYQGCSPIAVYYGPDGAGSYFSFVEAVGEYLYVSWHDPSNALHDAILRPIVSSNGVTFDMICSSDDASCWYPGLSFSMLRYGEPKGIYAIGEVEGVGWVRLNVADPAHPRPIGTIEYPVDGATFRFPWTRKYESYDADSRYLYTTSEIVGDDYDRSVFAFEIEGSRTNVAYMTGDTLGSSVWNCGVASQGKYLYVLDDFGPRGTSYETTGTRLRIYEKALGCLPDTSNPVELIPEGEAQKAGQSIAISWRVGCPMSVSVDLVEDGQSTQHILTRDYAISDDIADYVRWPVGGISGDLENHTYAVRVTATYEDQSMQVFYSPSFRIEVGNVLEVSQNIGWPFATIGAALQAAESGDTILVHEGTYDEALVLRSNIHLIAADLENVQIAPGFSGPWSLITAQGLLYPATLEGFTIGNPIVYSRCLLASDCDIVVKNCRFRNPGRAVTLQSAGALFQGCVFDHCASPDSAGGVYIDAGDGRDVSFVDCLFDGDSAPVRGGAVEVAPSADYDSTTTAVRFERCTFQNNSSKNGGAIWIGTYGKATLDECVFANNGVGAGGTSPYAIAGANAELNVHRCTFRNHGGGLQAVVGVVGNTQADSAVTISNCLFVDNGVDAIAGGTASTYDVEHSDFFGNASGDASWLSLGLENLNEDPAFCDGAYDSVYAFSACVPGVANLGGIGATVAGCVPNATVTSAVDTFWSDPSVLFACPQGDGSAVSISASIDSTVLTREIRTDEFSLDVSGVPFSVFHDNGVIRFPEGAHQSNQYTVTVSNDEFGGYGTGDVRVAINGLDISQAATFQVRSPDENGDGIVDIIDFGLFSQSFASPPKQYEWQRDYDADSVIDLVDYTMFGNHYAHATTHPKINLAPANVQETGIDVALTFTEEYVTTQDRRLYVDVALENVAVFRAIVVALRNENTEFKYRGWSQGSYPGVVMAAPVRRNGVKELFIGVRGSKEFVGTTARLGRLTFDVVGNDPLQLSKSDFDLRVGDVLTSGGTRAVLRGAAMPPGSSPIVHQVFHNILEQNYPNPFNPVTTIRYSISEPSRVVMKIYSVTGALVRTVVSEDKQPGSYRATWDGHDNRGTSVASGVYFYRLTAGTFLATKKMVLLK